jgi:phosphoglycolate phosphatase-like HAD superfamily hydrolase
MADLVEASGDSGAGPIEAPNLRVRTERNLTSDSWLLQLDPATRTRLQSIAARNDCSVENVVAAAAKVLETLARLKDNNFQVGFVTGPDEWRPIEYTI